MPDIIWLILLGGAALALILLADRYVDHLVMKREQSRVEREKRIAEWWDREPGRSTAERATPPPAMSTCACGRHQISRPDLCWTVYLPHCEPMRHTVQHCQPLRESL